MSLDVNDRGEGRRRAKRGSKKHSLGPRDIAFYSEPDQMNISWARKLAVMDMIVESGWETRRTELDLIARECISQASAKYGHSTCHSHSRCHRY
jgi:hypothetical protein